MPGVSTVTGQGIAAKEVLDGIYFNPLDGVAGTGDSNGTADNPVNNLPDVLTLMADRKTSTLILSGYRPVAGQATLNNPTVMTDAAAHFTPGSLVGMTIFNNTDGSSGIITANTIDTITAILAGGGLNIWTVGDEYYVLDALGQDPYTIYIAQNLELQISGEAFPIFVGLGLIIVINGDLTCLSLYNAGSSLTINGKLNDSGDFTDAALADTYISGDTEVINIMLSGQTFSINYGNLKCYSFENTAGGIANVYIFGNVQCGTTFYNNAAGPGGSSIFISGNLFAGAGINQASPNDFEVAGNVEVPKGAIYIGSGNLTIAGSCTSPYGLTNAGAGNIILGNTEVASIINSAGGFITITGNLTVNGDPVTGSGSFDNTGGGSVMVCGDCKITNALLADGGYFDVFGDLTAYNIAYSGNALTVDGSCKVGNNISNTTDNIFIALDCQCGGNIDQTDVGSIEINGSCKVGINISNTTGTVSIALDCQCGGNIDQTDVGSIEIGGFCKVRDITNTTGTITIFLDCQCAGSIGQTDAGNIGIFGSCNVGDVINNTTGTITIVLDCQCGNSITQTDAGTISIGGSCKASGDISNTTGQIFIALDCQCGGNIDQTDAGTIEIGGSCKVGLNISNATGDILIHLDCLCAGSIDLTGATSIGVGGDCYIRGDLTNDTSATVIRGTLRVTGVITNGVGTLATGRTELLVASQASSIDLNQAANTYDLFTANPIGVILESLLISMPNAAASAVTLTSISIQTDHTTPQVLIDNVTGLVANLTAEAQLAWEGKVRIEPGKKIQLTINGGAEGGAYVCIVEAQFKGLTSGGDFAPENPVV